MWNNKNSFLLKNKCISVRDLHLNILKSFRWCDVETFMILNFEGGIWDYDGDVVYIWDI